MKASVPRAVSSRRAPPRPSSSVRHPVAVFGRIQVRQGVVGDQVQVLGADVQLGHRAVADAQVQLDEGRAIDLPWSEIVLPDED